MSEIEEQGGGKAFGFTHELVWNTFKNFFEYQGATLLMGARDATREAFAGGGADGEGWMQMITSRNLTAHTHNRDVADELAGLVVNRYYELFLDLEERLTGLVDVG